MIKTVTLDRDQRPTEEMIREIREAAKREIVFDEDSPEMTPAMEKAFRLAAKIGIPKESGRYLDGSGHAVGAGQIVDNWGGERSGSEEEMC